MSTNLGDLLQAAGLKPSEAPEQTPPSAEENTSDAPSEPFHRKVVLRATKKGRGGKTVTEVQGVREPKRLAKKLRKQLGVGTSVDGDLVVVQGDQRTRLQKVLTELGATNIVIA